MDMAHREIFQRMISFIEQDAAEKVEEIESKSVDEFELMKANLIQKGCRKVNDDYKKKIEDIKLQTLIFESQKTAEKNLKLASCQYEHFEDVILRVKEEANRALNQIPHFYECFLKLMIEQAVLKILQSSMIIFVQEKNKKIVTKMLPSIKWFYEDATKTKSTIKLSTVFLDADEDLRVVVATPTRKIYCEISIGFLVERTAYDSAPYIKNALFGANAHGKTLLTPISRALD